MRKARWEAVALYAGAIVLAFGVSLANFAKASPQSSGGSGYQLAKKVTLGGMGGWDYLNADPVSHRVFISRGNHVMVVDADGNVVGDIPNLMGTHGAAIAGDSCAARRAHETACMPELPPICTDKRTPYMY